MKSKSLKEFIKKNYKVIIFLFVFIIFCYGFKLFTYSYGMDTEKYLVNKEMMLNEWLGINRFSLVALKQIFAFIPFQILVANWLTVMFFFIFTIFTIYNFSRIKEFSKKQIIVFGLIIASSPIFLEQFNFTLQSAEISFFLLLFQIGLFFFQKYIETSTKRFLLGSIIFIFISFGAYQAFVPLYISEIIMFLFLRKRANEKMTGKEIINYTLKSIFVFIVSFALYLLVAKLVVNALNIEGSNYLNSQIGWLNLPFLTNIRNIIVSFGKFYFGWIFNKFHYLPINSIAFGIGIFFIYKYLKAKKYWEALLVLFILGCPAIMTIVKGNSEPIRAQLVLPLVVAFLVSLVDFKSKKINFSLYAIIFIQLAVIITLEQQDYVRFQNDKVMAENIYQLVALDLPNHKVVFVGTQSSDIGQKIIKGEAIGFSFFNSYGHSDRAGNFMKTLGYKLDEEYAQMEPGKKKVAHLESYPSPNCKLVTANYVYVKLS